MHLLNRATIAAALLLLAVGAATLITRHYRAEVSFFTQYSPQDRCFNRFSASGGAFFFSNHWMPSSPTEYIFGDRSMHWRFIAWERRHAIFTNWIPRVSVGPSHSYPNRTDLFFLIPFWLPAAPFIIALALYGIARGRPPVPPHKCHACRYDKSGLDPATPCPECGMPPRNRTPTNTFTAETRSTRRKQ